MNQSQNRRNGFSLSLVLAPQWRRHSTVLGCATLSQQFWMWRTLTQKLWLLVNCMDLPWSIQCNTATGAGGWRWGGPRSITRNILSWGGEGKYGHPFAEQRVGRERDAAGKNGGFVIWDCRGELHDVPSLISYFKDLGMFLTHMTFPYLLLFTT